MGKGSVVYQHHIALLGPQRRQKAEVVAQLAGGSWGCHPVAVGRQHDVVFGVENI